MKQYHQNLRILLPQSENLKRELQKCFEDTNESKVKLENLYKRVAELKKLLEILINAITNDKQRVRITYTCFTPKGIEIENLEIFKERITHNINAYEKNQSELNALLQDQRDLGMRLERYKNIKVSLEFQINKLTKSIKKKNEEMLLSSEKLTSLLEQKKNLKTEISILYRRKCGDNQSSKVKEHKRGKPAD